VGRSALILLVLLIVLCISALPVSADANLCLSAASVDARIAACNEAIQLDPDAIYYYSRGLAWHTKRDLEHAIADYSEALRLAKIQGALDNRGSAYRDKGDLDRAIADYTEEIRLYPTYTLPHTHRGLVYEKMGDHVRARADFNAALALPQNDANDKWGEDDKWAHDTARARLAALAEPLPMASPPATAAPSAPATIPAVPAPQAPSIPPGRRVALVIGNANYRTVAKLPNPLNDARAVAAALRRAGFTEVIERHDLGIQDMQRALSAFEDSATGADWAVAYYAGHGIEVDGRNFLIPVDAQLKRASDIEDETLALDRVLTRLSVARKLQLVILDACRDNPFLPRMAQAGGAATRTVGTRGLARIEPAYPNLYVAYSAQDRQVALDGQGENSPYAKALVKYLGEPGLELGKFFRKVRDDVLAETSGKQRPFEYGSLTGEDLFFSASPR
jgi:tetratricopeptide (TPR) repeat protein